MESKAAKLKSLRFLFLKDAQKCLLFSISSLSYSSASCRSTLGTTKARAWGLSL